MEDEVQLVQTIQFSREAEVGQEALPRPFTVSDEYFPITRRQLKQSWRYLRRVVREGPAVEFDLEATVRRIAEDGLLLAPAFRPRRVNRAELLLLIDRDGSMVPFHPLSRRLLETAARGGRLRTGAYYFHNCPVDGLSRDPYQTEWEALEEVLERHHPRHASVLIFSDAGAARGGYSRERVALTETFLEMVREHLRHIAWLNPLPRARWVGTTAGEIANLVPMFTFSRREVYGAIDVLRGRGGPAKGWH